jgi:hypothetical protein
METILFDQDWDRYPTAIWDTKTKNETFLEFSALLKSMGVRNHLFMLALMQPELQGVDPFDEANLTAEQKLAIRVECTFNPWYFIREIMRVPPAAGDVPVPLIANRGNISLWWSFLNHIDYFLVQIRQTGKSLNSDGISVWYQVFGARNARSNLFTKGDLFKAHIDRLKKLRALLPKYLVRITKKDTDNQKEFTNLAQGNRMVVYIPQKDEDAARNLGRGLTVPHSHTDEIAFLKNVHISLGVMLAGGGAAREEAKRNGLPFGNIFTTTAGMLDSTEGAYAYKMMTSGAEWDDLFYDSVDQQDLYDTVRANSTNKESLLINGTFNHRQLGFDDQWLRTKIAESRQTGDEVRRDYLNEWTSGTLSNPLSKKLLRKIHDSVTPPLYSEKFEKEKFIIRWQIPEREVKNGILGREMTMGVDTSNATGRDNITGVILDNSTLEVLGVWTVNDSNLQHFSAWLARLIARHPTLTVIGEAKSTWIAILDYLLLHLPIYGVDPAERLYSRVVDEKEESEGGRRRYSAFKADRDNYRSYRKEFGFPTNGPLREMLYGPIIQEAAKRSGSLVRDKKLQNEIAKLVTKNKRIDHEASGHDDHVISWLMAHWFLTYAQNLDHYGIDTSNVKRRVYETEHKLTWVEQQRYNHQEKLRVELDELTEKLANTKNSMEQKKLELKIDLVFNKLDTNFDASRFANLDQIKEDMVEKVNLTNRNLGPGREIDLGNRSATTIMRQNKYGSGNRSGGYSGNSHASSKAVMVR